jgi:hypothetical protein
LTLEWLEYERLPLTPAENQKQRYCWSWHGDRSAKQPMRSKVYAAFILGPSTHGRGIHQLRPVLLRNDSHPSGLGPRQRDAGELFLAERRPEFEQELIRCGWELEYGDLWAFEGIKEIIAVEFDSDLVPTIATMRVSGSQYGPRLEEITCNPSKAYQTIFYHNCGSGPDDGKPICIRQTVQGGETGIRNPVLHYYWGAPGVTFDVQSTTAVRLEELPAAFPASVFLEGLKDDTQTIWCEVCEDAYPDELSHVCAHLIWCDECGDWTGPGVGRDACRHPSEEEEESQ